MRFTLEGSPDDIRSVLVDKEVIKESLELESLRGSHEELEERNSKLEEKLKAAVSIMREVDDSADKSRKEIIARDIFIKNQEKEINKLKAELVAIKASSIETVKFSPEQEAEIEAAFQEMLKDASIKPVIFKNKDTTITPAQLLKSVFNHLASGNRVDAIKEVRTITGIGLLEAKNLIHEAVYGIQNMSAIPDPKTEQKSFKIA